MAQMLTSCVALTELGNHASPPFSHMSNRDHPSPFRTGLLWGLNKITHVVLITTATLCWGPRMCHTSYRNQLAGFSQQPCKGHIAFSFDRGSEVEVICPSSHKFIQTRVCLIRVQLLSVSCCSPHRYGTFIFITFKRKSSNLPFGEQWGFSGAPFTTQQQHRFCQLSHFGTN